MAILEGLRMAKRKTCFLVAACVWVALLACGALNCAYADEPSDGANSWRFLNGELVLSDSGASTDNLGTFEEAAADSADSADGVMACSIEANPNGHYPVFNWFDQFSKGYCTGVGAYKGIDVSEWQGKINWAQVKTAGVDFAILRCGYASTYADTQWHNNVQGCLSTGMPFGVYLYSRATSPEEASKEADFVISQLKSEGLTGADLAFPVYFDMEDKKMVGKNYAAIAAGVFRQAHGGGLSRGDVCKPFLVEHVPHVPRVRQIFEMGCRIQHVNWPDVCAHVEFQRGKWRLAVLGLWRYSGNK